LNIPNYIVVQIAGMKPTQHQVESIQDAREQIVEKYKGKRHGRFL
jgi:hypothetical protein